MFKKFKKIIPQTIMPRTLETKELALKYAKEEVIKCALIEEVEFKNQKFTLLYTSGKRNIVIDDLTSQFVTDKNFVYYQFVELISLNKFIKNRDYGADIRVFDFLANLETGIFVTIRLGTGGHQRTFDALETEFSRINSVESFARKLGDKDSPITKKPDCYSTDYPKNRKLHMNFMTVWQSLINQKTK